MRPSTSAGTALVVDPETRSLNEVCKALREIGYQTFGATVFSEAKRFLITRHPEIMVADVRLGEFNGLQLLLLARELRPGTAVVITNAFADPVLAEETRRMGGTFLVKPVAAGELLETVRQRANRDHRNDRRRSDRRVAYLANFSPERRVYERRRS